LAPLKSDGSSQVVVPETAGDLHGDSFDLKRGRDGPSDPFCKCSGFGEGDVFGDDAESVTAEA
jgi:hypothetical protein